MPDLPTSTRFFAAREAGVISAHGEALELCRRAVRNLPAQLPLQDQAARFAALGDEAAACDDNMAAAEAVPEGPRADRGCW